MCTTDNFCSTEVSQDARCTKTYPRDLFLNPDKYGDAIIIGTIFDDSQAKHLFRENSVVLAAKKINELKNGKVDGRQFGVVRCTPSTNDGENGRVTAEAAAQAARYLVDVVGVPAIIGPADSTSAAAVFEELEGSGTLIMSPSATSTVLTGIDPSGLFWRTAPPDNRQAEAMATYLARTPTPPEAGSGDLFVAYADDEYGGPLFGALKKALEKHLPAGKLVGERAYAPARSIERDEAIIAASDSDATTVVFLANQGDVKTFLIAAVGDVERYPRLGMGRQIFLPDSAASADVIEATPGLAELFGVINGTRPFLPTQSPPYKAFRIAYGGEFGESPDGRSYASNSYDAAWLVFAGIAWSQGQRDEITGEGIAEGLRSVSHGFVSNAPDSVSPEAIDLTPSNWIKIRDSLSAGVPVNVIGASGDLNYDDTTQELLHHPYEIWEYEDATVKRDPDASAYLEQTEP